jgi:hypothetical protein
MAFYTPTWVRKLVKEDHSNIQEYLNKQNNDFRDYIDANTPFVLWLDIGLIRERILAKSQPFIQELALAVSQTRDVSDIIIKLLDKAYIATINDYATNTRYLQIDQDTLTTLLTTLSNADLGSIKKTIADNFSRTMVVTNVTKKNKSVMLILPKFTTLNFGTVFKKQLGSLVAKSKELHDSAPVAAVGGMFGGLVKEQANSDSSEKSRMLAFVNENFAKLQNIGHVEVDVISEADKKVMRGQNSPRLIQALVTLPNDITRFEKLQLKFSKETGQAATRVKVRKKFSGSKLVFELLIEHGLAVGVPETQEDNLYKAKLERAFTIGRGLSKTIRDNPGLLSQLETSKSVIQYVQEVLINTLLKKPIKIYTSSTTIEQKSKVTKTKVTPQLSKASKQSSVPSLAGRGLINKGATNLINLQNLINRQLQDVISANMGDGDSRNILNYRTGRLAASAKVERMSESRAGMITAFYSYMKNPYATFSASGQQQNPRSRDPKLLISKSIREIAATQVANQLRAVNI